MSKAPKTTQAEPTKPRPVDPDTGRQLDEHGLPLSGPARIRALGGKPDPRDADAADAAQPSQPAAPAASEEPR